MATRKNNIERIIESSYDQRTEHEITAEIHRSKSHRETNFRFSAKEDIRDFEEDFGVTARSLVEVRYAITVTTQNATRSGEIVLYINEDTTPSMFYNIYIPTCIRGFGIGRLLFSSTIMDSKPITKLVAIPASDKGRQLLESFGAERVERETKREWYSGFTPITNDPQY